MIFPFSTMRRNVDLEKISENEFYFGPVINDTSLLTNVFSGDVIPHELFYITHDPDIFTGEKPRTFEEYQSGFTHGETQWLAECVVKDDENVRQISVHGDEGVISLVSVQKENTLTQRLYFDADVEYDIQSVCEEKALRAPVYSTPTSLRGVELMLFDQMSPKRQIDVLGYGQTVRPKMDLPPNDVYDYFAKAIEEGYSQELILETEIDGSYLLNMLVSN